MMMERPSVKSFGVGCAVTPISMAHVKEGAKMTKNLTEALDQTSTWTYGRSL